MSEDDDAGDGSDTGDASDTGNGSDPLPPGIRAASRVDDPRGRAAWASWLSSLASDADAAAAAACLYVELPGAARDAWIDALDEDVVSLGIEPKAAYGPLLATEDDPVRAERLQQAAGFTLGPLTRVRRALLGTSPGGGRLTTLVVPLYLDFVRLLVCRFHKQNGFEWVRQQPWIRECDAPRSGSVVDGVELFTSSLEAVVDELAHAVLAHRRCHGRCPPLLTSWADLFSARLA